MSTPSDGPKDRFRDLCFLDVETTGAVFGFHEIIDIGAVRTTPNGMNVKGQWSSRLRPRYPERITVRAREVNGYTDREWSSARESSREFWTELAEFMQGCVPVGHNPSFDRAFITLAAAAEGVVDLKLDYHWIGTESLAWPWYVAGELPEMSLPALCAFLSVPREADPHRAINGAITCSRIYCELMARQESGKTGRI